LKTLISEKRILLRNTAPEKKPLLKNRRSPKKKASLKKKILAPGGLLETRDTEIPAAQGRKIAQNQPESRI